MQFVIGVFIALVFAAMMIGAMKWRKSVVERTRQEFMELEDSYTYMIDGLSWGPEVVGVILNCGPEVQSFTENDLAPEKFEVTFTSRYRDGRIPYQTETRDVLRPVKKAYFCDIDGNILDSGEDCSHLLLEFNSVDYTEAFSPFYYLSESPERNVGQGNDTVVEENCLPVWKEVFTCSVRHPLFANNINTSNDPIYSDDAKECIKRMGLKMHN